MKNWHQHTQGTYWKDPISGFPLDFDQAKSTIIPEGMICGKIGNDSGALSSDNYLSLGPECVVNKKWQWPCNPPLPPTCSAGYIESDITLDTFGGETDNLSVPVFGQRWIRYCSKKK
ncbi:MAG: hypothetical protein H7318_12905 [Oligoflexus sp.]|nr:hypothetical protein [Oligoflexus sp.]